nr:bromodomain-containing protein 9-like [Ipomoea batatas]
MGKATAAATVSVASDKMKRKKKKGRPSLSDLRTRDGNQSPGSNPTTRRSTRRNPNLGSPASPPPEFDEDDDERKEKKVKLVGRLPQSSANQPQQHFENSPGNSDSGSDPDDENLESSVKKRKVDAEDCRSELAVSDQGEKTLKAMDTQHGSPLASGPTTPLPDKKLLVFILDRLQKKDTYGVFSEPVDPNELPDYHEIIEHPMDFGTVRKKLDGRLYSNLEELEADVNLICSNAMQYNAPDTVYFRQARSIQDLAKRDFENLRHEGEDGEPQPKVVRRGRPPSSKNMKKSIETSPVDRVGPEISSGATLASGEDKAIGSNSYNLRKAQPLYRFRSNDVSLYRSRNGESYSERSTDWNDEFPASILRADMKYGSKHFALEDNRRDTYKQFHSSSGNEPSLFDNRNGNLKWLMAVGLQLEQHAYARSLARYAANLGPVAWKVASKKLQHVLPPGVQFGPGWVGEGGARPQPSCLSPETQNSPNRLATSDHHSSRPLTPPFPSSNSATASTSSEAMVEAVRKLNSLNEMSDQRSGGYTPQAALQKSIFHPNRNGMNGMFGYDLNVRVQPPGPASPSSSIQIGSPKQPDLALQL